MARVLRKKMRRKVKIQTPWLTELLGKEKAAMVLSHPRTPTPSKTGLDEDPSPDAEMVREKPWRMESYNVKRAG